MKDLDTFVEAVSATIPKKTLMQIYAKCTAEPYSSLYVKLNAKVSTKSRKCFLHTDEIGATKTNKMSAKRLRNLKTAWTLLPKDYLNSKKYALAK